MAWRTLQEVVAEAFRAFVDDDAVSLAAAVAFYSALSLAPVTLLVLAVAGVLWEEQSAREAMIERIDGLIGQRSAEVVDTVIERARGPGEGGTVATVFGIATVLFASTTVFAQLQYALNRVWGVQLKNGLRIRRLALTRLFSLGMIVGAGVLLVASLVASSAASYVASQVPIEVRGGAYLWQAAGFVVSVVVFTVIFAAIFKVLPDAKIAWRDVGVGAFGTAVVFAIGKELIGLYIGRSGLASTYGAAGSLVVLLLWVYFASIILLAGAEFAQVFAKRRGQAIEPKDYAERLR